MNFQTRNMKIERDVINRFKAWKDNKDSYV